MRLWGLVPPALALCGEPMSGVLRSGNPGWETQTTRARSSLHWPRSTRPAERQWLRRTCRRHRPPFTGVAGTLEERGELILRIRDTFGTAFLFVAHDLAVARYISDRLAEMHQGHLVESGETDAVIGDPQQEYTRTLLAASEGTL